MMRFGNLITQYSGETVAGSYRLRWLLVLVVLSQLFVQPVSAGRVLHIATGEWSPYVSEQLPGYGCLASMISEALALEGYEVQYYFMPWKRGYMHAKEGTYDATAYWYRNKQREEDFLLSRNHFTLEKVALYYRSDLGFSADNYADFVNRSVVLVSGYTYPEELWQAINLNNITVVETRSELQNFEMLMMERADFTVMSERVADEFLENFSVEDREKITKSKKLHGILRGHLLVSREIEDGDAVRDAFDRGFEKLMSDAEYKFDYLNNCSEF